MSGNIDSNTGIRTSSWYGSGFSENTAKATSSGIDRFLSGAVGVNDTIEIIDRVRKLDADDMRKLLPDQAYKSDFELLAMKDKAHRELAQVGLKNLANAIQGGLETLKDLAENYLTGGNKKLAEALGISNSTLKLFDAVLGAGGSNINSGTIPDSIFK